MLLSVQWLGALYSLCALIVCIIVVCGCKLARLGYRTLGKKLPSEPPPKEKEPPEPVYYPVERKKRRVKQEYEQQKRIRVH